MRGVEPAVDQPDEGLGRQGQVGGGDAVDRLHRHVRLEGHPVRAGRLGGGDDHRRGAGDGAWRARPRGRERVDEQLDGLGRHRRVGVERDGDVPGVDGVLAEPHGGQAAEVAGPAEHLAPRTRRGRRSGCSSIRATRLSLAATLSATCSVGGLAFHRSQIGQEGVVVRRLGPLEAGVEEEAEDLGLAAQVGGDVRDAPLVVVGGRGDLVRREGLEDPANRSCERRTTSMVSRGEIVIPGSSPWGG